MENSIFVDSCFCSYFHGFGEDLILKNQYVRKLISLGYTCRNEFSFIRIILNSLRKLTFLLQLFSKFRENVIWPVKAKSPIFAKIFFRETLQGLCIETDDSVYFWRRHNRFLKKNYLKKGNFNYDILWIY